METQTEAWLESSAGQQVPLRGSCFFGRAAGNTVVLADDKVSRRHAMVHTQGEHEFWLVDLGSANGTYLNGRRLTQPCRLSDRDQIRIGSHSFSFHNPKTTRPTSLEHAEKTIQEIKTLPCWLLVADIESSTQFTQRLPPEEAPRITGRWLSDCKQVIDDNAGAINKFLGDGFLAYWHAGEEAAPSVAKALKALHRMQDQAVPRFRVVLHHGKVFVGGGGSMGEESLMGNEVNFVFRMEKMAGAAGAPRLMSAPAEALMKTHVKIGQELRQTLPSFEGEFSFYPF
ncbi:MAG: adenylate/guanylate cyclase domain-containing protein [Verrucomicrobia subdivision 3 bacterium]|nr:adenylate/guanylate cyclase domain-containing protein [Limisphaerales bacterium]